MSVLSTKTKRIHLVDQWEFQAPDFPRGAAFNHRGLSVGTGYADGTIVVLEAVTGKQRWRHQLDDSVAILGFDPSGERLAVACFDGSTHLFDSSGTPVARLPGASKGWVEWLSWSSTGLLATAQGKSVRVWTRDGKPVLETPPHESTVSGVAFSPDGSRLMTSCYGAVRLFPLEAEVKARTLQWKSSLLSLTPSPDGKVIAVATQDNSVHFWRLANGRDSEMSGYPTKPTALAWSPDSKLLCTGGGNVVCGWRFVGKGPEGTKPLMLQGHEAPITRLSFAKTGLLASGAIDGDVLLWEPFKSETPLGLAPLENEVHQLTFNPEGDLLLAANSEYLKLWSVARE